MNNQPTKESVRKWLQQRQTNREPLPSIDQIRRELGWKLIEHANAKFKDKDKTLIAA